MDEKKEEKSILWEKLYQEESSLLYGYLVKKAGVPLAQDILQESFLRLLETMNQDRTIENHRAYLFQIARHLLATHYRDKLETLPQENFEHLPALSVDSEEQVMQKELLGILKEAKTELNEPERELFELRWNYGLKQKEISAILSRSERQIRRDLESIAKKLRHTFVSAGWTLDDFITKGEGK